MFVSHVSVIFNNFLFPFYSNLSASFVSVFNFDPILQDFILFTCCDVWSFTIYLNINILKGWLYIFLSYFKAFMQYLSIKIYLFLMFHFAYFIPLCLILFLIFICFLFRMVNYHFLLILITKYSCNPFYYHFQFFNNIYWIKTQLLKFINFSLFNFRYSRSIFYLDRKSVYCHLIFSLIDYVYFDLF